MNKPFRILASIVLVIVLAATMPKQKYATWQASLSNPSPQVGDVVTITITADIANDWYLYSNDFDKNLGPMVTSFGFVQDAGYQLVGDTKAIAPKRKYDDIWEGDISYFTGKATFEQQVKILHSNFEIAIDVKGQVCSDVTGKCVLVNEVLTLSGEK